MDVKIICSQIFLIMNAIGIGLLSSIISGYGRKYIKAG
jgi:hypothetical protein